VILNNFKNSGTTKTFKRFRVKVFTASLSLIKGKADSLSDRNWQRLQIFVA